MVRFIDFKIENFTFCILLIALAMDAVTDVNFAILMSELCVLVDLNLDGSSSLGMIIIRKYWVKLPEPLMLKLTPYSRKYIIEELRKNLSSG